MSAGQQTSKLVGAFFALRRVYRGIKLTLAWMRVIRKTRAIKPDVIVVSMILHSHIQWMVRQLLPSNVVLAQICHEFTDRESATGDADAVDPLVRRLDRVFLLSEATRLDFIRATGFAAEKTTRMPHGNQAALVADGPDAMAIREKLGIEEGTPVLLFFGVLRRSKGLEDLAEAFAVSKARETAKLVIAGRATKYIRIGDLADRIADLGIENDVILHNAYIETEEVRGFFDMAQAVVLPYRSASASGVLHLAYTCEKPVIATSIGGLAEDVVDGETGILVPPESPKDLAAAIDRIMFDPKLAAMMGARGKVLSTETHSWENAARIVTETLADDLEAHRRLASRKSVS